MLDQLPSEPFPQGAHIDVRQSTPSSDMTIYKITTLRWQGKTYHLTDDYPIIRPSANGGMEQRARDSDVWVPCKEVEA